MESIKKNFLYNILYQMLIILIPLITAPYLSRKLGVEGIGGYSYNYAIANYFVIFINLGIGNYGNRSIAASRNDRQKLSICFWEIFSVKIFLSLIIVPIYISYGLFICESKVITLILLLYVFSASIDISWLYFGLEKFKITVTRNTIIKIVTVLCIFIFVKSENDLWKYTLIMSMGTFISQLYLWFTLKKYIDFVKISFFNIKKHIKPILIMFIPVIAYSIYKIMDKIMLGGITDMTQSGIYENSEKIVNIPLGVITALGTVMLPRMSNMVANKETKKSMEYINYSFQLVTIIASAIVFGLIGVSNVLVPIFFGEGFFGCVHVIKILSLSVFFVSWANVIRTQYLIPFKKDKVYVISSFCGAVINFILNIVLIKRFGAIGAGIATLIAEAMVFIVQVYYTKSIFAYLGLFFSSFKYILLGMIMSISVYMLGEHMSTSIFTLVVQVLIGGVIFIIGLLICVFTFNDKLEIFIRDEFSSCIKKYKKK